MSACIVDSDASPIPRRVRSFVRRGGRITQGQQRALDTLWPRYGLDPGGGPLDLDALFGRRAPRVMEIGFGDGEALASAALAHPATDHLGVEVHRPGVGHLLLRADALGLDNLKVVCADAVELVQHHLPVACMDRIQIFFPDPWPKKRHHKRRIIQPAFAEALASTLTQGGILHLATDWEPYAENMLDVLESQPLLSNVTGSRQYSPRPAHRPPTRFERRGRRLGNGVWDLLFERR